MAQQYLLPCSCGQKVRVASAQAGGDVVCACGKSLSVPTLRGLRELELAPPEVGGKRALAWSPIHGAVFSAALLVAAAGLAIVAFYLWRYAQVQVSGLAVDRSSEMVRFESAQIDAQIDKLTPEQALDELRRLEKEGIGQKLPLVWAEVKKTVTKYLWWTKLGGGMIVGGALVAVAVVLVGRR